MGKTIDITLVESDEIGTVGVGEATIPPLLTLHNLLKIKAGVYQGRSRTFKLGIQFVEKLREQYVHPFGFYGQDLWAAGFQLLDEEGFRLRGRLWKLL